MPGQISVNNMMYYEQARLKTFERNWSQQSIDPRILAKTGLYFVGPGDKVKCAFCNKFFAVVSLDNVLDMHELCPLICRFKTPNVPIQPGNYFQSHSI